MRKLLFLVLAAACSEPSNSDPMGALDGGAGPDADMSMAGFDPDIVYPGEEEACSFSFQCGELQVCVDAACVRVERLEGVEVEYGEPEWVPEELRSESPLLAANARFEELRSGGLPAFMTATVDTLVPQDGVPGAQRVIAHLARGCLVEVLGAHEQVFEVPGIHCTAALPLDDGTFLLGGAEVDTRRPVLWSVTSSGGVLSAVEIADELFGSELDERDLHPGLVSHIASTPEGIFAVVVLDERELEPEAGPFQTNHLSHWKSVVSVDGGSAGLELAAVEGREVIDAASLFVAESSVGVELIGIGGRDGDRAFVLRGRVVDGPLERVTGVGFWGHQFAQVTPMQWVFAAAGTDEDECNRTMYSADSFTHFGVAETRPPDCRAPLPNTIRGELFPAFPTPMPPGYNGAIVLAHRTAAWVVWEGDIVDGSLPLSSGPGEQVVSAFPIRSPLSGASGASRSLFLSRLGVTVEGLFRGGGRNGVWDRFELPLRTL